MDKIYRWTVDVDGGDFGGRTNGTEGITKGLPKITQAFKDEGIKSLIFISTELLETYPRLIEEIRSQGHEIGSHGHFHTKFREGFRREADRNLSLSLFKEKVRYRAPKFSHETEDRYSQKKGHVSLLRHMWLGAPIKKDTIIYLHPFDIVGGTNAPNLFCHLWYSQPNRAWDTFKNLLSTYRESYINAYD